ncbi:MAG: transglutaminase domain-containing protein [Lachnospiraceae bacterium]|nr:transglutaminase domain-containing protein [Lachnospiraceae bacterium]
MKKKLLATVFALFALTLLFSLAPASAQAISFKKRIAKEVKKVGLGKEDSDKEKLKKIFQYVSLKEKDSKGNIKKERFGYDRPYTFAKDSKQKNWTQKYAKKMLLKKKGSCYQYAALYGYMALKATGLKVQVGVGTTKGYGNPNQPHAWTEVKIGKKWYIYDTIMDKNSPLVKKPLTYCAKKKTSKVKKQYYTYRGAKYYTLKF